MRSYTLSAAVPAVIALASGHAEAQQPGRREFFDQPPRPIPRPQRVAPPNTDGPGIIQVNTNGAGQNILGDAANEPSMTVDPTAPNRIAVGWRQFDTISSNFRQAGRAYSRDGGRTWTNPGPLTPGVFRTDPVLDTTSGGRFYYFSLSGAALTNCDMFASSDGGASWTSPVSALGGDKNWFAIDRSGGPGAGNLYLLWSPFFSCCGANIFGRSIDGGLTFGPPQTVPESPYFGTIATGPGGEVYIAGIRMSSSTQFAFARSSDAGNPAALPTFDLSRIVNLGGVLLSNTGTGPNPGGLNGQVWVVPDPRPLPARPVYILCTVDPGGVDPGDVMIARSFDGGQTWGAPIRINDDAQSPNNWQWMGTLAVAPNGRLDAVWIDTRDSLQVNIGRLYYSFSIDAGATWSPNVALTPAWNSFLGYPQQNKIGDYYQLVSDRVGADLIFAATLNGEQDVFFTRIGDYDCNGNGIADAADLAAGTLHDCNANGIPDECEIAAGVTVPCACYANCDFSTAPPILNANDFQCFLNRFAEGSGFANCDHSTAPPVLNANDFQCFLNKFAAGCP